MLFVKTENLKTGMRLARPLYSKTGVLLFDRNTQLSAQAIDNIRNFGLFGIYVLEPAEPLPPMSPEDIEFERFQAVSVSALQEEMGKILATKRQSRLQMIANTIVKKYGHLDGKINFYQNLRSKEDFVYRHALNVAILCTMMTHVMNIKLDEQMQTVCAALIHDIGKINYAGDGVYDNIEDEAAVRNMLFAQQGSLELIESASGSAIRRICLQILKLEEQILNGEPNKMKLVTGAKVLLVANKYDEMTAMNLGGTARSEVKALQELLDHPDVYDPESVLALVRSINILMPGVGVELSTGEKAMVLTENPANILRPVVLSFMDNSILDLSAGVNSDIYIEDIMKTMDNRYIMDANILREAGMKK